MPGGFARQVRRNAARLHGNGMLNASGSNMASHLSSVDITPSPASDYLSGESWLHFCDILPHREGFVFKISACVADGSKALSAAAAALHAGVSGYCAG
jgi:hypothetical protein